MTHFGSREASTRKGLTLTEVLVMVAILAVFVAVILPSAPMGPCEYGPRPQCRNNLKFIALALHVYAENFGTLPPAYTVDEDGKRLHSWRTLLLPYLDQRDLYQSIDLSKTWDDPVNAKVFEEMPAAYRCPLMTGKDQRTSYLGVGGPGGFFRGVTPRKMNEITDKPEETLMVIEVGSEQGVPWMAPQDADEKMILDFTATTKWPHGVGRQAAFVDGSVRTLIASETTVTDLKRMMTIAGGD